ncbi:hypothetical protein ACFLXU_02810 [Chloroflexota bacterium]
MKRFLKSLYEHWKAYPYIRAITWCIAFVVCFAIAVQWLRSPSGVNNNAADQIFKFLDDWAVALGASVTLLLAVAAFWSIMDNRHGRIVDRTERRLNEIIEWAIDIENWRPKEIHKDLAQMREELKQQELMGAHIRILMDSLIRLRGRNQYATTIAMKLDKTVKEAVDKLVKEVELYIGLLYEWETIITSATAEGAVVDDTEEFNNAEYQENFIVELTNEVIEQASKIY